MKLFSVFREGKIKPAWQFQTTGNLWRILFSDSGRIVGEDRDQGTKTVTFFCLNETSGAVLWRGLKLDEQWWIGVETIYDGIVFLHGFVKPDLPQHQKIIALDIETGRPLWRNDSLRFLSIVDGKLFASEDLFEKRLYFELNPTTGEMEREYSEDNEPLHLNRRVDTLSQQEIAFPEALTEDAENSHDLEPLIRSHCDLVRVSGNVEFVHRGNLLFFNYHQRGKAANVEGAFLENRLKVIDTKRKRVIFSDLLNDKVLHPTPDSFLLKGGDLFYIKNKNTLVAIRVEDLERKV